MATYRRHGMWKGSVQNRFDSCLPNIFPPYMTYQDILWNFLPWAKSGDLRIKKKIPKNQMMLNLILGVRFPDQDRQDVFQVPQVAQVLGKVKTIYQKHQLGSNV